MEDTVCISSERGGRGGIRFFFFSLVLKGNGRCRSLPREKKNDQTTPP